MRLASSRLWRARLSDVEIKNECRWSTPRSPFARSSWTCFHSTTSSSFRAQIAVEAWDRSRLLEDVARTFAEHGANIVSYGGQVEDGMARNWYTAEVGDMKELRSLLTALRNLDAVVDAYRFTPS